MEETWCLFPGILTSLRAFHTHPSHFHPPTTHSKSSEVMAAAEVVQVLDEDIGYGGAEGVEPVADWA